MTAHPPSAEQIEAIREDWQGDVPPYMSASDVWIYGRSAVRDLLAVLEAAVLRAQDDALDINQIFAALNAVTAERNAARAALRPFIDEFWTDEGICQFCFTTIRKPHKSDCPIVRARTVLGES